MVFPFHPSWALLQKATLKFAGLYHKLESNRPSGSVLTDLLGDVKKAFYEQEGKQFTFEQAWQVLRHSPKWSSLSDKRALNQEVATAAAANPNPSTPAPQEEAGAITPTSATTRTESKNSWKRPPGMHTTKHLMKEENFNMQKIKVLSDHTSNYRAQTLEMKKTNNIQREVAKAKVHHMNMDLMAKKEEDLPDEISRAFLRLQKQRIFMALKAQIEREEKVGN